jgi:hypothetical protein
MAKKTEMTLDELLISVKQQTKTAIAKMDDEDINERNDTVENVIKEINAIKEQTNLKKGQFIKEVKSGLIDDIKENKGVRVIPKTRYQRFVESIRKFFLKF